MSIIKLIDKDTNMADLEMHLMPWDIVVHSTPYQAVRIKGYVHTIGGRHGNNDFWMYPRHMEPSPDTLIQCNCAQFGACWGIKYEPTNYITTKWYETECNTSIGAMITRNGEDFYSCLSGIDEARYLLNVIDEHPLNLNDYNYTQKLVGRKVWWRSQPAVITRWIGDGQACVVLKPEDDTYFKIPPEFAHRGVVQQERYVKADIFDRHIWWFREE